MSDNFSRRELARRSPVRFPNESAEYRAARTALLAEEIELRRHLERVAAQRRALPPGGEVTGDYRFEGENGPVSFADLFGDKQSLASTATCSAAARGPCPMCTNLLGALEGNGADIQQRMALAVVARSPIERLDRLEEGARLDEPAALQRSQRQLFPRLSPVLPDGSGDPELQRLHAPRRDDPPLLERRDDRRSADPGQDPRGAPDFAPLGTCSTPRRRGAARTGIRS